MNKVVGQIAAAKTKPFTCFPLNPSWDLLVHFLLYVIGKTLSGGVVMPDHPDQSGKKNLMMMI